jgi:hypothetical protein
VLNVVSHTDIASLAMTYSPKSVSGTIIAPFDIRYVDKASRALRFDVRLAISSLVICFSKFTLAGF